MKIVVDFSKCDSNALCQEEAPGFFEVRDDGFLYILNEAPEEKDRAEPEAAAKACPNQAITVAD